MIVYSPSYGVKGLEDVSYDEYMEARKKFCQQYNVKWTPQMVQYEKLKRQGCKKEWKKTNKSKRPAPMLSYYDYKPMQVEIDEYDKNGKLKFNMHSVYHKDLQPKPGLYLLKFSNGMYYVGQTHNILERINQHYRNLVTIDSRAPSWYKQVNHIIKREAKKKGTTPQYEFYHVVKLQVQYTSTLENAKQLEKMALSSVYKKGFVNKYYNTEFFVEQADGSFERKMIPLDKKYDSFKFCD